jgi:hypothetical protein
MILYTTETITVGQEVVIDCCPVSTENGVVFEDDGQTGYLYAIKGGGENFVILDAVHIYNVANVTDKEIPSEIKIYWNENSSKAALHINDYCHAIMDFKNKKGLCRTGFPPASQAWPDGERKLTDQVIADFNNE